MGGLWIIHKIIMAMPQTLTPRAIFSLSHPLFSPFSPPNFPFLTPCFSLSHPLFFPFSSPVFSFLPPIFPFHIIRPIKFICNFA